MTTAIFVAGMRGVGKSTLLIKYGNRAVTIEAEKVQAEAVKIAKGEGYASPYDWSVWDELKSRTTELLREALKKVYPNLEPSDKPMLIVGSLLVIDWFHQSFIESIRERFPLQATNPLFFILHLDEKIISDQIEERGRPHEAEYVNDLEKIRSERNGYLRLANSKWRKMISHEDLHTALSSHI